VRPAPTPKIQLTNRPLVTRGTIVQTRVLFSHTGAEWDREAVKKLTFFYLTQLLSRDRASLLWAMGVRAVVRRVV